MRDAAFLDLSAWPAESLARWLRLHDAVKALNGAVAWPRALPTFNEPHCDFVIESDYWSTLTQLSFARFVCAYPLSRSARRVAPGGMSHRSLAVILVAMTTSPHATPLLMPVVEDDGIATVGRWAHQALNEHATLRPRPCAPIHEQVVTFARLPGTAVDDDTQLHVAVQRTAAGLSRLAANLTPILGHTYHEIRNPTVPLSGERIKELREMFRSRRSGCGS